MEERELRTRMQEAQKLKTKRKMVHVMQRNVEKCDSRGKEKVNERYEPGLRGGQRKLRRGERWGRKKMESKEAIEWERRINEGTGR